MVKKIFTILFITLLFLLPRKASAQENKVNLYLFWSKTCPHCEAEREFLQKISPNYPNLVINDYEVGVKDNVVLLQTVGQKLNIKTKGVPITVIGNDHFIGYYDDVTNGKTITNLIEKYESVGDPDTVGLIIRKKQTGPTPISSPTSDKNESIPKSFNVPILGSITTKNVSLPFLTITLGALDGFNPCAMWTLLFLISLLLGMKDKRRRWILGSTFIAASAFVYFLFMAAWLNLVLFIGFIIWVRIVIGLIALGGGSYNLKEYFTNKEGGCKVTGDKKRKAVFENLRSITQRKQFTLALGGIIILAFAVNLVELICSAGLPVVFTQILAANNLTKPQYYTYMILYILIFMLDDLFVFVAAMVTLEVTGLSTKYARASHLIGGILMILIGILIIFKPELLAFG